MRTSRSAPLVTLLVVLLATSWLARPTSAQAAMRVSVLEATASSPPVLGFTDQLPGGSSQIQVSVANTGPDAAQLSIGGADLVVGGACLMCATRAGDLGDLSDLLVVTIASGANGAHVERWRGTPRELIAIPGAIGVVPARSELTLTISEELPVTVGEEASAGRLSMSLSFLMVDLVDGSREQVVLPSTEVAGTSVLRPGGAGGLPGTGEDIGRLVIFGASLVAAGGVIVAIRRRSPRGRV
jgi:hypothetical protein